MRHQRFVTLFLALFGGPAAAASIDYAGGTYSQDFDTLAAVGTSNAWVDGSTLAGWSSNRTLYRADTGSSNAGSLYSFGGVVPIDRALGSIASTSTGDIVFGPSLVNLTGQLITGFTLSYAGEQWRNGGNLTHQRLGFAFSVGAASLTTGTYTDIAALDFTSPVATATASALNGDDAANRTMLNTMISGVDWGPNEVLWLRWTDFNDAGTDHGLAIDDLSFTAVAVPEPSSLAMLGLGALGLAVRRRRGPGW